MLIMGSLSCIQILQIKQRLLEGEMLWMLLNLRIIIVFKYSSVEDLIINNTISTKMMF